MTIYDAIIIGAGHNGLTNAAYLAKAGLNVVVLEKNDYIGGASVSRGPTGTQMGVYLLPPIGAGVWVEFEQGDPDYPIWVGCRWGSAAEVPALALAGLPISPNIVLQSAAQNTIMISDVPGPTGGIMLKSTTGATIIVNDTGIYIQNGKGASLVMAGPTVTINNGALLIT